MEKEQIKLNEEELREFDFTDSGKGATWKLKGETYLWCDEVRTDAMSDGPSWETIVQRKSDDKFFKWNCWDAGYHNGYIMSDGDIYQMEEVFPKTTTTVIYE